MTRRRRADGSRAADDIPEVEMEPVERVDIIKKICVIGDSGVGKKTILSKVAPFRKEWERYTQTIGTAITKYGHSYSFVTADVNLLIIIWDVTGQASYQHLQPSYYKGAEGIVVMADAHDEGSIANLPHWVGAAYKQVGAVPTVIVINKMDLVPEELREHLKTIVKDTLGGLDFPTFYIDREASIESLKEPFFRLAELLQERIKVQLERKRAQMAYRKHQQQQ